MSKKITCAMFAQSAKTSFCRKIIKSMLPYICLDQHCTRKLPVQSWRKLRSLVNKSIIVLATSKTSFYARTNYLCNVECTAIFSKQNNLYNVVLICLGQHCTRKLSLQYWPTVHKQLSQENNLQLFLKLSGPTLHEEITCAVLTHGWQTMFIRKITHTIMCRPCSDS